MFPLTFYEQCDGINILLTMRQTIALLMSRLQLRCAALHRDAHNLFITKGGEL